MPDTTQCPNCGVVLTLPDGAKGRRLRCPKCQYRFAVVGGGASPPPAAPPSPSESGTGDRRSSSTLLLSSFHGDEPIPMAEGDLRETFDIPLMTGEDAGGAGDASGLFRDANTPARKPVAAEARAKVRRCPTCGAVVPAGMVLCTTCGLNLETGQHIGLDENLDVVPAMSRGAGIPIGIGIVGGISLLGGLILAIISLVRYAGGGEGHQGFGLLGLVCAFGVYSAVQFLRGKSVKLLLIALSIGALAAAIALIALPIYEVNAHAPVVAVDDDPFDEGPDIKPLVDRIDYNSISWGIASLLAYAAVVVYLASPGVRRHFSRQVR